MMPSMVRLCVLSPLLFVVIVREALSTMSRLITSVMVALKEVPATASVVMSPPRVMRFPLRVKAEIEVLVLFRNWMPPISVSAARLFTGVSRVLPPNCRLSPAVKATPPQFSAVLQLSLAPPPFHTSVAAGAWVVISSRQRRRFLSTCVGLGVRICTC